MDEEPAVRNSAKRSFDEAGLEEVGGKKTHILLVGLKYLCV